ncbi:glycosyltransferase family 4 protein [Pseudomonas hunanensis]|uniref:glycosyltransferase family 4 protein n=1 Tax=Pseudomonas hunanensis TaxID=1247546 RepID=UPI0030DCD113
MTQAPLKIAVVSQYFFPENFIINDIVRELSALGVHVEVFTGKPNYPSGQIFPGYTAHNAVEDRFSETVAVHRAPLRPRHNGGAKNLVLNYLSFVANGVRYFTRHAKRGKFDVYFVFAPSPIISVIPALAMKRVHRAPVFLWVQDLWPESLAATGFIRNRFLLSIIGLLVRGLYWAVDVLLVQSRAFIEPVKRYARADKIIYYPNSYLQQDEPGDGCPLPESLTALLRAHFCVVFAGNLGSAQGLATVVDAARILQAERSQVRIVMVGAGSKADWLAEQKDKWGLDNLVIAGAYPRAAMVELFELSAALLVTLKRDEIFSFTIPSKVQAYLAAGRPIIGSLDGEGARIINDAGAGVTCPAEDAVGLAACIRTMQAMPDGQREQMGAQSRAYFLKHFELKAQCKILVRMFEQRVEQDKATQ